jgi:hypothetical protein
LTQENSCTGKYLHKTHGSSTWFGVHSKSFLKLQANN